VGWEGFLARAGWDLPSDPSDGEPEYLAQTSLFRQFPALEGDMATPDYVWADIPDYNPPPELLVNAWIGGGGVVSPAHTVRLVVAR
jgi:lysine-specific demethylase 8